MTQRFVRCTLLMLKNAKHFNNACRSISIYNSLLEDQQISFNDTPGHLKRIMPLSTDEYKNLKKMKPSQPENPYFLKVSILGEPNVGKSTLTNRLVKWRVCAVSSKVHTTRRRAKAVLVEGDTQIVFLDTPGFVTPEKTKRHSLEPSFVMDPMKSIREADLLAVVVDISDKWTNNRINPEILRVLYDFKEKKSILILNKIDAMKSKGRLLSLTRILTHSRVSKQKESAESKDDIKGIENKEDSEKSLDEINNNLDNFGSVDPDFYENIENERGWPLFSKVFMVSALKNDGVEDLRNYLLNEAKPRNWDFHEGLITDQDPREIALMTVRENLLEYLPNEIPYKINLNIKKWEMLSTGCPKIDIEVVCPNSRHRRFVIGPDGKHVAALVANCKKAMRESFRRDVVLKIAVV